MGSRDPDLALHAHPYATLPFAETLAHIGTPLYVEAWGTHVLVRDCGEGLKDAIGPYPRACLAEGADLVAGVDQLRSSGLVSIALAIDCLTTPAPDRLERAFDLVRPFKTHYVVDTATAAYLPSRHHRQELRRTARRGVQARIVSPVEIFDDWVALYEDLVARHPVAEMARFSRASFAKLVGCDGLVAVGAFLADRLVSCHLWFAHDHFAWSHLAATSDLGYATGASYAVYDFSIQHFHRRLIDLGGTPGSSDESSTGLARFKSGFSNATRTAYLTGSVLDHAAYARLCGRIQRPDQDAYFPAYRSPHSLARSP